MTPSADERLVVRGNVTLVWCGIGIARSAAMAGRVAGALNDAAAAQDEAAGDASILYARWLEPEQVIGRVRRLPAAFRRLTEAEIDCLSARPAVALELRRLAGSDQPSVLLRQAVELESLCDTLNVRRGPSAAPQARRGVGPAEGSA